MKHPLFAVLLFLCHPLLSAQSKGAFFANFERINQVAENWRRGERSVKPQMEKLLSKAIKELRWKVPSVMAKKQTPPSGDRHDYMSMAPYWWPDPSTEDGLPYIRKDGERNPEKNTISDHSNFTEVCSTVFNLSLAHALTGQKKYAEKVNQILRIWFLDPDTRMNPNLNFAQAIKGRNNGRGSGIIESRHLIFAIDGIAMLRRNNGIEQSVLRGMREWLTKFSDWLWDSSNGKYEYSATNNHGTWYGAQALSIALFLNDSIRSNQLAEELRSRINSQITPEGTQPKELTRTNSLSYSHFNLRAFFTYWKLARCSEKFNRSENFPESEILRTAVDFHLPYATGQKKWEYQQINDASPEDLAEVYFYAYYFWNDKKYLDAIQEIAPDFLDETHLILTLTGVE